MFKTVQECSRKTLEQSPEQSQNKKVKNYHFPMQHNTVQVLVHGFLKKKGFLNTWCFFVLILFLFFLVFILVYLFFIVLCFCFFHFLLFRFLRPGAAAGGPCIKTCTVHRKTGESSMDFSGLSQIRSKFFKTILEIYDISKTF